MAESAYKEMFVIHGRDFQNAGEVSSKIRNILKDIGLGPDIVRRVAIISFEAEMNCVMYADRAEFRFVVTPNVVVLSIEDAGPGIPDTSLAMQEGYSTAPDEYRELGFGAGMGLPNMKRNSDEFSLTTVVGQGTKVEAIIRLASDEGNDDDGT